MSTAARVESVPEALFPERFMVVRERFPEPADHLLHVPADPLPQDVVFCPLEQSDWCTTREAALEECARLNADGDGWWIVIQVGLPAWEPRQRFRVCGRTATLSTSTRHPVRVVRPTEDEIARHGQRQNPASVEVEALATT